MSAPRKLAAILAADVAGYSRLTGGSQRVHQSGACRRPGTHAARLLVPDDVAVIVHSAAETPAFK